MSQMGSIDATEDGRTANARRVARHRRKKAEMGVKQLNIEVPVEAHETIKVLAGRLRNGEPLDRILFDLAADCAATETRPMAIAAQRAGDVTAVESSPHDRRSGLLSALIR